MLYSPAGSLVWRRGGRIAIRWNRFNRCGRHFHFGLALLGFEKGRELAKAS